LPAPSEQAGFTRRGATMCFSAFRFAPYAFREHALAAAARCDRKFIRTKRPSPRENVVRPVDTGGPPVSTRGRFLRLGCWRWLLAATLGWPCRRKLPRSIQAGRLYLRRAQNARGCAPGAHFLTKNKDLRRILPKLTQRRDVTRSIWVSTYGNPPLSQPLWRSEICAFRT
jgi:hypothetical protein